MDKLQPLAAHLELAVLAAAVAAVLAAVLAAARVAMEMEMMRVIQVEMRQ
jgi:hypothetical protein